MAEVDQYFLGYRRAEQERLQRQALELAPEAQWLFDQIGVKERGAGRRNRLWATGLPRTPLRSGRPDRKSSGSGAKQRGYGTRPKFAAENKLANVEVLNCDARATSLPRGAFDLATARLVLVNIPEPGGGRR